MLGVVVVQVDTIEVSANLNQSKIRVQIFHKNLRGEDWDKESPTSPTGSAYQNGGYYYGFKAKLSINGSSYEWTFTGPPWRIMDYYKTKNPTGLLLDKEIVVPHNPNGQKSFVVSGTFANDTGAVKQNLGTFSVTHQLERIVHTSTAMITGNAIGSPVNIAINRNTSALTHKLYWTFGPLSGTISENATTSATWTPSLPQLSPQIPNSSSGKATIRLETYVGAEKTGERNYEITLNLPSTVKPTLTGITLIDGNDKAKALNLGANNFVQAQSNIRPRFDGANGIYGSQIVSYRAEIQRWVNNQWQATTLSTTANNGLTGNANFSGRAKVVAYVTDSRGRQSDRREVEINYLPYHVPAISFRGERTGADDVKINVVRNLKIAPLTVGTMQKNTARLSFDVVDVQTNQRTNNVGGSANWTGATEHEKINWTATLDGTYDVGKTYLVIGKLSDTFHTSTFEYRVGVQAVPVSISKHGLAVGKEWTRGVLDVGNGSLPAYFDCDIYVWNNPIQMHQLTGRDGQNLNTGTNPDSITKAGFYYLLNGPGRPNDRNGYLLVQQYNTDTKYINQLYIDVLDGRMYNRVRNNGVWQPWKQLATTDLIGSQKHKLSEDNGVAIQVTGDWNNVTTTGFYQGNGLANQPSKAGAHSGYYVRVTGHNAGRAWVLQEAVDFNGVGSWYRVKLNGVWQPWKEYTMASEVSSWTSTGVTGVDYKVTGDVVSLRINIASLPSATTSLGNIPSQYLPAKNAESRFKLAGAMLYISANGAISTRYGASGLALHTQVTWQI
ncbi:DUF859 family phage minor structural protein [Streptococcus suis]